MFDKSKLNEVRAAVKAEAQRRNQYGSIAHYGDSTYDPGATPTSGSIIRAQSGIGIIDPLVSIKEFGDIRELVHEGGAIPDDFNENKIITYVNELKSESMTGNRSSCRGACTGLCIGTCGGTCNGCSGGCGGGCISGCNTSCTNTSKV